MYIHIILLPLSISYYLVPGWSYVRQRYWLFFPLAAQTRDYTGLPVQVLSPAVKFMDLRLPTTTDSGDSAAWVMKNNAQPGDL